MFGKLTNWFLKTGPGDAETTDCEVITTTWPPLQKGGRQRRDDTKTRWKS